MPLRPGQDPSEGLARAAQRGGVTDPRVLDAMRRVDRRNFVPPGAEREAARDAPVRIGAGQTTSQPSLVALMVQGLELRGEERVLEVGGGLGYQTALLAELAAEVWSVELYAELAESARESLTAQGVTNAHVIIGDGSQGLPDEAPFDGIIVSAATAELPEAWGRQLTDGGRLVVPLGGGGYQEVVLFRRREGELVRDRALTPVRFVPLRSEG